MKSNTLVILEAEERVWTKKTEKPLLIKGHHKIHASRLSGMGGSFNIIPNFAIGLKVTPLPLHVGARRAVRLPYQKSLGRVSAGTLFQKGSRRKAVS